MKKTESKTIKLSASQTEALKGACTAVRRNNADKTKPQQASTDDIKAALGVKRLPTATLMALVKLDLVAHKPTSTGADRWRPTPKGFKKFDELVAA